MAGRAHGGLQHPALWSVCPPRAGFHLLSGGSLSVWGALSRAFGLRPAHWLQEQCAEPFPLGLLITLKPMLMVAAVGINPEDVYPANSRLNLWSPPSGIGSLAIRVIRSRTASNSRSLSINTCCQLDQEVWGRHLEVGVGSGRGMGVVCWGPRYLPAPFSGPEVVFMYLNLLSPQHCVRPQIY